MDYNKRIQEIMTLRCPSKNKKGYPSPGPCLRKDRTRYHMILLTLYQPDIVQGISGKKPMRSLQAVEGM